jgi:hypothetical protein
VLPVCSSVLSFWAGCAVAECLAAVLCAAVSLQLCCRARAWRRRGDRAALSPPRAVEAAALGGSWFSCARRGFLPVLSSLAWLLFFLWLLRPVCPSRRACLWRSCCLGGLQRSSPGAAVETGQRLARHERSKRRCRARTLQSLCSSTLPRRGLVLRWGVPWPAFWQTRCWPRCVQLRSRPLDPTAPAVRLLGHVRQCNHAWLGGAYSRFFVSPACCRRFLPSRRRRGFLYGARCRFIFRALGGSLRHAFSRR